MNDLTREFLKKKIGDSGLSQVEIAQRLSMTPSHISRMLSGERDTTLENLVALADILRIDRAYLLRLASGLPPEPEEDAWVDETTHKIKLIKPGFRSVITSVIDGILDGSDQADKNQKPSTKRKSSTI